MATGRLGFHKESELTKLAKVADLSLMNVLLRITDEQCKSLEKVLLTVVRGTGQTCLLDFSKHIVSSVPGAVKAWKAIDDDTKELFKDIFKGTAFYIKTAIKVVKEDAVPEVQKRAADLAATLMA